MKTLYYVKQVAPGGKVLGNRLYYRKHAAIKYLALCVTTLPDSYIQEVKID